MRFRWIVLGLIFFMSLPVFAETDDPIEELNRQKKFSERVMKQIQAERLKEETEKRAELEWKIAREKKAKTAVQLAEQFKGLSSQLSQIPEVPNFTGELETREKEN